ncbi:MAG TPA: hypothetical protein VKG05_02750 [Steroidobacteraceae bacterium]|nr:hypothetical protein [Steroidobacteraceae bacterium]
MQLRTLARHAFWAAAAALIGSASSAAVGNSDADQRLSYDVSEGLNLNSFLRDGPVAAHLVLRSGHDPRILVAFPAGNSGVGLWFKPSDRPLSWALQDRPQPLSDHDDQGRPLFGIVADVSASGADLAFKQAVLSSIRVLRDYQSLGTAPAEVAAAAQVSAQKISWERHRLDGAPGYRLSLEVTHGELHEDRITAGADGRIGLRISALTGETPLTPLSRKDLLEPGLAADAAASNALTFLSYREKFLAGSWRFDTYFGRDTLMSVRLLMPVLTPIAVESGLAAVLTRLSPAGEVAHEEDIGESAVLAHRRAGEPASDRPIYDYKMIDGNFMLAPVVGAWLREDPRGTSRAAAFLASPDHRDRESARTLGADLVANLRLVLRSAAPFARDPRAVNLVSLKPGVAVGQWRDSGEGLGRGRFAYDVNAVFVPAALAAANDLLTSGLLDPYLSTADREQLAQAGACARIWRAKAPGLFEVAVPYSTAVRGIAAYGHELGVPIAAAQASIDRSAVRFHALSLAADGTPIPIVNSDEGFELLFGRPSAAALAESMAAVMRPFPAGLLTDAGVVVANPVYAAPETQARFSNNDYHGTVVWSWQQALLAAGLDRQLKRDDLPQAVKQQLRRAQDQLWRVIDAGTSVRNSELWSWRYREGRYQLAPFGASQADVDESNAAQLWSTVYLAIPEPPPLTK